MKGYNMASRSQAQREAARRTVQTGRIHTAETRRGFFSSKTTVKDTGRIANPVQRREAQRNS